MVKNLTIFLTVLFLVVCLTANGVFAKKTNDNLSNYPITIDVQDYEDSYMQRNVENDSRARTEGTVIGTSDFDYATAYYGRSIAIGPDGTLHAIWCMSGDPSNEAMYARSTDQGVTWSTPIEVHDGYYGYKPSVAAHPTDPNVVVVAYVGYQESGETRSVRMTKSTDGGLTFGASIPVFGSSTDCNNPDVLIGADGSVHVVMDNYTDNFLRYNMSSDGGDSYLAEPELINLGSNDDCFSGSIAMDQDGTVHVVSGAGGSTGSWGDKDVYWNYRNMTIGLWMEIPWVAVSETATGTPYPSLIFDSQNVGHLVYDAAGTNSQREVFYRTLTGTEWSDPTGFPSDTDGGSTFMPGISIDKNDNLYLAYIDAHQSGTDLTNNAGDIFTGTNASGEWEVINFTGTGTNNNYNHPGVAAVVVDSLLHLLYTGGSGTERTIEHAVGYPWPPEPTIGASSLSDTYNTEGPFTITAGTGDIDGEVVSAVLTVQQNGEIIHTIEMTQLEKDSYETTFSITAVAGDVIAYFGTATDNDGNIKESIPVEFDILTPTQYKADILLLHNDVQDDTFYTHILDKLGYVYEVWDYDAHNGIDASVTNFGWGTILGVGWVLNAVPTRGYEGDPFAAFLESGTDESPKNLLVASMDYFFANGEVAEPEFEAGDFAYDFLQIGLGTNDPDPDKDSLLVGITDDPISGNWDENMLWLDAGLTGIANWIDWTEATGNGLDVFFAANQGFGTGVSNDAGTFKTAMLPFMLTWIVDSLAVDDSTYTYVVGEDVTNLTQNILNFFGTSQGELADTKVEKRDGLPRDYSISQNYPNPFNPETSISFTLPNDMNVELDIYNAVGQKIKTLVNTRISSGSHVAVWDGRNNLGQKVSTGVYFYKISAGDFSQTKKMVMIK
jgi:hypothetical protein